MSIPAFPLHWPESLPRTERRVTSQFKTGITTALKNVKGSLELFARDSDKPVTDIVLSSNVGGLDPGKLADPGVAAWFTWDGERMDEVAAFLGNRWPVLHMLRGVAVGGLYPFHSVDSSSLGQNGHRYDWRDRQGCVFNGMPEPWSGRKLYANRLEAMAA